MTEIVHTDVLSPADRFDAWCDAVASTFVPLEARVRRDGGFRGGLRGQSVGTVQVSDVSGGPVEVERTAATIRRSDPGYLKLGMQLRGYCLVTQDGREAALTPGDFAVYDTRRPYGLAFEDDFRQLVLMFPRELLRLRSGDSEVVTARRISGRRGIGALVSPFLMTVAEQMETGQLASSFDLGDAVLNLLAAAFAEQLGSESNVPPETHQHALLLKIKAFIDARLDDPELSSPTIAGAHNISIRYLQMLFEGEGITVTSCIRRRRLERVSRDLRDPRMSSVPIGTLAGRWGLIDSSYFSKLFRSTFGQSPREYRATMTAGESAHPLR
ncbi:MULTISPECIES: AraC-like ligand-binding domain-containing protein [Rhodococcus]|uniref:Putative AraC family transcriptional regulator n=1 Tax=Rhodococcus wratislaviensis NBRC 100605 TaxID=1219028 RepID=X0QDQ9_RHOWR|nr:MULTISPECIES: helix-turn-helix domain-containing protein [Rhodococcus]WAM14706.1 helix-turn-helix domain-containing protein [Rhodococcus sp. JS3073]GAF49011.1 putative AraC family transcriptional regulator [Rhodococcus wratislaviensis NBRC 100605]